jgi:hypothetical protein
VRLIPLPPSLAMPPPTRLGSTIESTRDAASHIDQISNTSGVPFLGSIATLSLSILQGLEVCWHAVLVFLPSHTRQSVKSNKESWIQTLEQIDHILSIIVGAHEASNGVVPPQFLYDIARFSQYAKIPFYIEPELIPTHRLLQKMYTFMMNHQRSGRIKQLFSQLSNAAQLETCRLELQELFNLFKVRVGQNHVFPTSADPL